MPIGIEGSTPKATGADSPNARRIAKVLENDAYNEALEWSPPESREFQGGALRAYRGKLLLGVAVVLFVVALIVESFTFGAALWANPFAILAYVAVLGGVFMMVTGKSAQARAIQTPLLKRAALITDRRSDTKIKGWTGDTTYYFQIEFEGGIEGEFAYPGHGSNEEPYVTNLPGVAYTRGETLLAFKHVRV